MSATITRNTDAMPAGRLMDSLVAEKVMRWELSIPSGTDWELNGETQRETVDWSPSRNATDALLALESPRLAELGFLYFKLFYDSVVWCCELNGDRKVLGQADTSDPSLSLAVCRAILKAIDAD